MEPEEQPKKRLPKVSLNKEAVKRNKVSLVLVGAIVVLAIFGGYYYLQYQDQRQNPEQALKEQQEAELNDIIARVGALYTLPKDEKPSLATVQDINKLKDQPFFSNAQNGDKLLIFSAAKQAIIYRPSTNMIINVGPIAITQQANKATVRIIGTSADRDAAEKTLASLSEGLSFSGKGDAKDDYRTTVVVDVTGKNPALASQIAAKFKNATVGALPAGEPKPENVDILVIAGSNR